MEIVYLEEKAKCYNQKIKPRITEKFTPSKFENQAEDYENYCYYFERKKHKNRVIPFIVCFALILAMSYFSLHLLINSNNTINMELVRVIERVFTPKDFGKIKFVGEEYNGENEKEAYSFIDSLNMPFSSCYSLSIGETFLLKSPSEITVKCAMDGVVESIACDEKTFKKSVTIRHKFDIKTEYYLLDNVSVKEGDSVTKNTIIGLALSGDIGFKITYRNSVVKGLEIVDGELSFT